MKTTYKKPITEITILRLLGSVLDDMNVGGWSKYATRGDANVITGFDEEEANNSQSSFWE